MTDLNDENVLARAAQGDTEAFSALYNRYVERIYSYIFYRTGSTLDAEDLTSRVFHRAIGHIGTYTDRGVPFSAWLYRIAHNLVANWHRDNSRRNEVPLDDHLELPQRGDHPEAVLVKTQEMEKLLTAIRKLPDDRQQIIILKFTQQMTNSEIAMIMARSEGAVKSLYHRTLLELRVDLEKNKEHSGG
jgi:RNA polymerase sigma-70 factor (ECF subfamily)